MAIFNIPKDKGNVGAKRSKSLASVTPVLSNYGITQPSQYTMGGSGFESAFDNILPRDEIGRNKLYRRIYQYDSVSGAAVDLMALLPFSDLSLAGVEDKAIMRVYQDTMEQLNVQTLVPQIATEFLIIGKLIGTLVFNDRMGIFTDIITQDPDYCLTEAIPLQGYDPKVDLRVPPDFRKFLTSKDPRDIDAKNELPESLVRKLLSGRVALDPMTTLYISRKTFPNDMGTSYLSRVVPFFILEQLLLEGTITGAQRRQRAIMHITAGSEDWEPTAAQLEELIEMFMSADLDPVGAVVATKRDVDVNEVRQGGDFWKVTDEWDSLTQAKMRSLGINESFLSGDACLTGDTLIRTESGEIPIADLKNKEDGIWQDIDIKVASRFGWGKVSKWHYNGIKPTLSLNTNIGNVNCTYNHPMLIFRNGLTNWVKAENIKVGDLLCRPPKINFYDEKDYDYVPILSIDDSGLKEVFDLSMVKGAEPAFVANGFISHNTYNCVTGDTVFETRSGKVEIGEIARKLGIDESLQKEQVVDYNFDVVSINGWEKNSKIVYQGLAPCKHIYTEDGYELTCTENHPILSMFEPELILAPSKHLREGDRIVVARDINRLEKPPKLSRILSIRDVGFQPVYDLSMAKGTSHIFVGNGIYQRQTMEAALSVFIETLRAFRFFITQKIFYYKLFPILAKVHRFIKRKSSELDHNIRITGSAKDIPVKDLIMPEIQWHKQLAPSYDESYFSILSSVQEQGLPIPLRVWAAAGGFSIEKLLDGLDDDIEVRKKLGEYKEKLKELPGVGGEEEEAGWGSVGDSTLKKRRKERALKVISNATRAANSETATKEADKLLKLSNNDKNLPASKIVVGEFS